MHVIISTDFLDNIQVVFFYPPFALWYRIAAYVFIHKCLYFTHIETIHRSSNCLHVEWLLLFLLPFIWRMIHQQFQRIYVSNYSQRKAEMDSGGDACQYVYVNKRKRKWHLSSHSISFAQLDFICEICHFPSGKCHIHGCVDELICGKNYR